jgi:pimeloyl-ACP methyl ester carboxylesterase
MKGLAKALYAAGFHVLNFSSSTYFNFIVNASSTSLPGYLPDDTRDLYRVMEQAWALVKDDIDASSFVIAGYSLGGISAAFLARHDESAKSFNFARALMINPPVDLYNSVTLLDSYLGNNVQRGRSGAFLDEVIEHVAVAYQPKHGMSMDEDFLFRAYQMNKGKKRATWIETKQPDQALVGLSFRISSAAMVFAGDVMSHSGYITPADKKFNRNESLEYYAYASTWVPFAQYVDELLLPSVMKAHPGATREELLFQASLKGIEPWLKGNAKVWALSNADEIILAPGELDYMKGLMGERIRVYPRGGHCGNILHRDTVRDIVGVLRGESLAAGEA